MVINNFDTTFRFPMSRKLRKNTKVSILVFTTCVIVVTTALVNVVLFSRGCASNSGGEGSVGLPVDPVAHNANSQQQSNVAPAQLEPVSLGSDRPRAADDAPEYIIDKTKGRITFPNPAKRDVIGRIVEEMGLKTGFEVGVRQGVFSKETLVSWPSCQSYFLVDLWSNPDKFLDAGILQSTQEQNKIDAFKNTAPWKDRISHCQNFSTVCALRVRDNQFDYGYIDARHDFKSVYEDLEAWYPKIRTGGVMGGHDYLSAIESHVHGIEWYYNADGSKDFGRQAVKGAVNLFFAVHQQHVAPLTTVPSFTSWVSFKAAPGMNQPNDLLHFIDFKCFDESECDHTSNQFLHTIRTWESRNPGFLSLVWTPEIVSWYLKEDVEKYKTSYKNEPEAYEDMLKLKIIHRFGGTYIHESITPLQGLQSYVDALRGAAPGPAVFCEHETRSGTGLFTNDCKKVSSLLISGKKDDPKILELAKRHEREFGSGVRSKAESAQLTENVFNAGEFNVIRSAVGFPCDVFTLSAGCVAQIPY